MRLLATILVSALVYSAAAAEPPKPDPLTQGMVRLTIKVGATTQAEVLETFGAPNITTMDGNNQEVWVYDRHATVTSDSSSGFSVGILGGVGGGSGVGGAGLGFGKTKSRAETSTRTMTLIIKFNNAHIVSDFKSRSSAF